MTARSLIRIGILCAGAAVLPGCGELFGPCIPDGDLPTVSITTPAGDTTTVRTPSILFEGIAEDNTGVELVEYVVNSSRNRGQALLDGKKRASFKFAIGELQPGRNDVVVFARDLRCSYSRPEIHYVHYEGE